MTEHDTVGAANCPHCQEDVSGEGPNLRQTGGQAVLVCPNCDTVLGGGVSEDVVVGLASLALAEDFEEVVSVLDELNASANPAAPDDGVDEETRNHYAVRE